VPAVRYRLSALERFYVALRRTIYAAVELVLQYAVLENTVVDVRYDSFVLITLL
jgi:hypothetical protein